MSTGHRPAVLAAVAVMLAASCDRVPESVFGPVTTATTEQTDGAIDTATTPATASAGADHPDCRSDARTIEFAVEGFAREYGRYPVSQDELVGDWLRRPIDSHELGARSGRRRRPGVPCNSSEPPDGEDLATTADELFAELSEDDIEDWGGVECARELATILGGGQEIAEPIVLWTTDARGGLVAAAGAPCHGLAEKNEIQICRFDQRILTGATRAFVADVGRPPADPQELIDAGYLGDAPDGYTLSDGDVTVVAGGRCAELRGDSPPGQLSDADCKVERRTLSVAVEAFIARNGTVPESERDLVTGDLVRAQSAEYDIEGGEIVPSPDSHCR